MQHGLSEVSNDKQHQDILPTTTTTAQHGSLSSDADELGHCDQLPQQQQQQPRHVHGDSGIGLADDGVDAAVLGDHLRRLSANSEDHDGPKLPGQRIFEYENALSGSVPTQALGFKVMKRSESPSAGMLLSDFPNGTSTLSDAG